MNSIFITEQEPIMTISDYATIETFVDNQLTVTHRRTGEMPNITPASVTPSLLEQMGVPTAPHADLEIVGSMEMYLQGHWGYNEMIHHRNSFIGSAQKG